MAGHQTKQKLEVAIEHTTVKTSFLNFAKAIKFLYKQKDSPNRFIKPRARKAFKIGVENGRKWFMGPLLDPDVDSEENLGEHSSKFQELMERYNLVPPQFTDEEWITFDSEKSAGIAKSE